MKKALTILVMLWTLISVSAIAQRTRPAAAEKESATIAVKAYSSNGAAFLGPAEVFTFVERSGEVNLASKFQKGIATEVPYGVYRLDAGLTGFLSEVRTVRVFQKHVTVVLGLPIGELPYSPTSIHGRVVGALPSGKRNFVKATGIFSSWSVESDIATDGGFDFSWSLEGTYLLMVLNEDGILASRVVKLPYGPGLQIELGKDRPIP